jgi:hypothetical protein
MINKIGLLVSLMLLLVSLTLGGGPVLAQGEPTIIKSSAEAQFPLKLTFSLQAKGTADITDVRLYYLVQRDSFARVVSEIKPVFTPGLNISASWLMDMRQTGGLPSGAVVEYWWTVSDTKGKSMTSSPQQVSFDDTRYQWRSLKEGNITLFWYEGNNAFASTLMTTAREGLTHLEADTGAYLSSPVRLYIYANSDDLKGAMIYPQDWTGGVAYTTYNTIAIGIAQSDLSWGKSAMVHELTHLVTHQMTRNPYGSLPNWMVEGLSMYAEGELQFSFNAMLLQSLEKGTTISVRSLCSPFSAYAEQSYQAYAQSYSLIDYLVATYGQKKLSQLLKVFQQGSDYDEAFLAVYGFNMDELDKLWLPYAIKLYLPGKVGAGA